MRRIVVGAVAASVCAFSAMAAATASAEPPEFGTCVEVAKKTGEYSGKNCRKTAPGRGKYNFVPAGGQKFTYFVEDPLLKTESGREISCAFGEGEGEFASGKTVNIGKIIFQNCQAAGAKTVYESFCQNIAAFRGEVTTNELVGELGYIENGAKTRVGVDVKPKVGNALATFECGGANELTERGMGTGTLLEVEGSAIGRIKYLNKPTEENLVTFTVKGGKQVPEQFEGGVKDTLTTLEGLTKTAEATTFSGFIEAEGAAPLEVKAK